MCVCVCALNVLGAPLVCRDARLRFPPPPLPYFLPALDGSRPERVSIYEQLPSLWCFPLRVKQGALFGKGGVLVASGAVIGCTLCERWFLR